MWYNRMVKYLYYKELIAMSKNKRNILSGIHFLINSHQALLRGGEALSVKKNNAIVIDISGKLFPFDEITENILTKLKDYAGTLLQMLIDKSDTRVVIEINKIALEKLESLLNYVEKTLPPDKKEVYFLPYKASMWDSLESVWEEYEANEEWNAYVMPIPYYNRKQDGSLGELHWEGEIFPKNVTITDYNRRNTILR